MSQKKIFFSFDESAYKEIGIICSTNDNLFKKLKSAKINSLSSVVGWNIKISEDKIDKKKTKMVSL